MTDGRVEVSRADFRAHESEVRELLDRYYSWLEAEARNWFDEQADRDDVDGHPLDDFTLDALIEEMRSNDREALAGDAAGSSLVLARDGDDAVGVVYFTDEGSAARMQRLFVREEYRGQGLGKQLVRAVLDEAADRGFETVRLVTDPYMDAARELYRDLGFEPCDPFSAMEAFPEILREEFVFMRRSVDASPP